MNTKTGVKDTEVVSTREKENGSDEGQTKIDSEATEPKAPTPHGFPVTTVQEPTLFITHLLFYIY